MRYPIIALALASFTAFTAQAKADIITTYNVTGNFEDGSTMTGTLTMDTSTALATAMDVLVTSTIYGTVVFDSSLSPYVFNTTHLASSFDTIKTLMEPTPVQSYNLELDVAAPGFVWPAGVIPLINYTDADIAFDRTEYGIFNFTFGIGSLYQSSLISGELDPISAPEPATLTMLGTGFLAVRGFGLCRRRRRRASSR